MTPMIDVVFLLLTFFIYALVLMVRAEVLPMELPALASATPARPAEAATISLDQAGSLFLDRELIELEPMVERLRALKSEKPNLVVYIAAQEEGDTDRLPVFLRLFDRLALEGLNLKIVGRPKDDVSPNAN